MTSRADRQWQEEFDARRGVVARHDVAACDFCGEQLPERGNRSHEKRFCDDACRAAAYRRRRAGLPENLPVLANDHGRHSLADVAQEQTTGVLPGRGSGFKSQRPLHRPLLPDPPAHITPTSYSTLHHNSTHAPAGLCP